jgi:hypothetical protein
MPVDGPLKNIGFPSPAVMTPSGIRKLLNQSV